MKKSYVAEVTGWINGAHRVRGRSAGEMTDEEAKYLVKSGQVILKEDADKRKQEASASKAAPAPAKTEPDPATLERRTTEGKVERTR